MFRFFVTISLFVLCSANLAQGQNEQNIEQLKEELKTTVDPEKKAGILYNIGDYYYSSQRDSCIFYLTQSYQLSAQLDDLAFRSKIAAMLGSAYQVIDMEKSTQYLFEGLEMAESSEDPETISFYYNIIGSHYRVVGDLEAAAEYFDKSIDLKLELKDSIGLAACYNNLGIVHMMKAEYDTGLDYWMKSMNLKLMVGDSASASSTMSNIGIYYKDIGRTQEALNYFNDGLEIEMRLNILDRAAHSYQYLDDLKMSIQDYSGAIASYQKSIEMMDSIGMKFDKREPLLFMSEAYEKSQNYKMAYETLLSYNELNTVYQDSSKAKVTAELATKYESDKKEKENAILKSENEAKDARIKEEEAQIALKEANNRYLWIGLGLVVIILVLIVLALGRSRKAKDEIQLQKQMVDEKNREITDSISYAKRLQTAILPTEQAINDVFSKNFVLYIPKDIVAGDFYWLERKGNKILYAVADCTGHGVPGAFVSIVCHNALNRAVREFKLERPSDILDKATDLVIETFEKSEEEVKDGMDISICCLHTKTNLVEYAGANNAFYYIRDQELFEIKPTKQPVGQHIARKPFVNHEIQLVSKDIFYLFTDGFADQFGGEKGKKFKYKNFKALLLKLHQKELEVQHDVLRKTFIDWKGDNEQIDDVCITGIIIP